MSMTEPASVPVLVQGLFAFWAYDQYPWLLGGHVTRVRYDGNVETREFGTGHWFHPVILLPEAEGEKWKAKLDRLEREFDRERSVVARKWKEEAEKEIPFLPKREVPKSEAPKPVPKKQEAS